MLFSAFCLALASSTLKLMAIAFNCVCVPIAQVPLTTSVYMDTVCMSDYIHIYICCTTLVQGSNSSVEIIMNERLLCRERISNNALTPVFPRRDYLY